SAYRATFDVTELHWTRAVPGRPFWAALGFGRPRPSGSTVTAPPATPPPRGPPTTPRLVLTGRAGRPPGPTRVRGTALPARPAPGRERSLWASGAGLPVERPDEPVFTAEAVALSTDPKPAPGAFRVEVGAGALDEGFRDAAVPDAGSMTPGWTAGLPVWRTGR